MPVDWRLVRLRIEDVQGIMGEIRRLVEAPFDSLSLDQIYSLRYNIIILVESIVTLATHILKEEYSYIPRSIGMR